MLPFNIFKLEVNVRAASHSRIVQNVRYKIKI